MSSVLVPAAYASGAAGPPAAGLTSASIMDQIGAQPTADSGTLSYSQLVTLARNAGLDAAAANIAAAIAIAESGGRPRAHNGVRPDDSYGLWQINMIDNLGPARRARYGITSNDQLYDPATNARAMASISGGGAHWGDWTTYTNQAYRQYLNGTNSPAPGLPGGGTSGSGGGTPSTVPVSSGGSTCLIGDITMPGSVPNIPCLFYESWGWAMIGALAIVAGGVTIMVGGILLATKASTVRQALGVVGGPAGRAVSAASSAGSRSGSVTRGGSVRPLQTADQIEENNFLLAQQREAESRPPPSVRRVPPGGTPRMARTSRQPVTREDPF